MLFVGTILFSFSLFGKVIGCLMLVNAGFNFFVLVKYPQYDDAQRKDAQSEIKDYLAANPAFAQQFVALGVSAGAGIIASNPGMYHSAYVQCDGRGESLLLRDVMLVMLDILFLVPYRFTFFVYRIIF
jgi:hypothetical protein